jgi:xylulose-5-phosphate/fructose-6-phosphate phosphoketolase
MVGSKQPTAVYFTPAEAEVHCRAGGGILKFASTEYGQDPDVVLVGIGNELTFEVVKAALYLKENIPEIRVRVVNVTDIMILPEFSENRHPHAMNDSDYASLFVPEVPTHVNYHGYIQEIKGLMFGRPHKEISFGSYMEEGSTTTPFDMMLRNGVSRFDVAKKAIRGAALRNEKVRLRQQELVTGIDHIVKETRDFIYKNGVDPDGIYDMVKV